MAPMHSTGHRLAVVGCNPSTGLAALHESLAGTPLKLLALQQVRLVTELLSPSRRGQSAGVLVALSRASAIQQHSRATKVNN